MKESGVTIYHSLPLCTKCKAEVSKVQKAAAKQAIDVRVKYSFWKRFRFGLALLNMPVVVINGRPFSVLGAFKEETLIAELTGR